MRKQRDARIVTFEQDYKPNGYTIAGERSGNPMKKGSKHAVHKDVVDVLQKQGVKMKVEVPHWETLHAKAKEAKQRKSA